MVKNAGPGVYSATYSNIPVYEFQFGPDLKEHVMRRRHDDWINATHILKAAGFDKPARTRILEREVQKELHEKVQGGYGKYQGTWVPLEHGQALAVRNNVFDKLRTIFEFVPGNDSPPPAPKHTTNKPKVPKKPAVPKFHSMVAPSRVLEDNYDNISDQLNDDETPDNTTVASASFMDDDDRYDMSQQSTGHRKRKRDEPPPNLNDQNHTVWADELLDYFMLSQADEPASRPEPPPNFQPNWKIDTDGHTAMHWAASMGDIDVMKQLRRFGADLDFRNVRGETALMRAVMFTNCQDKQAMPRVVQELISTVNSIDPHNSTVLHHAAMTAAIRNKHQCARYYLDVILNKISEIYDQDDIQNLLDLPDNNGNTAIHLAAENKARKCVRALIGRGASTDIPNNAGVTAEDLIQELNSTRRERNLHASSSPFAPDSHRRVSFHDPIMEDIVSRHMTAHTSEAAMSIESKITPMIIEKFQDLAKSFDDELVDLDKSEKEAKRLLATTQSELATIREQIAKLEALEVRDGNPGQETVQLQHVKQNIISLVEHQQQLRLGTAVHREESIANGHMEDDSAEARLNLYSRLEEAQQKRVKLVDDSTTAIANAGMGERGEMYRKLTARCLGLKDDEIDEQLDSLLNALEEDRIDVQRPVPTMIG